MKSLFFGGVHPEGRKELSASAPLTAMALPAQVRFFSLFAIAFSTVADL